MNKFTHATRINRLKSCIETIKDVIEELRDDEKSVDCFDSPVNRDEISYPVIDRVHLEIAVNLISKTYPPS